MIIGAHWKVFDRSGKDIDKIENDLREITQHGVDRTEVPTTEENYDSEFVVKGDVETANLQDACDYMSDAGAYPV